jgi:D-alanyl-D-alanine carboxypeptidase
MLPSGNDAAYALAEHFGDLLYYDKYCEDSLCQSISNPYQNQPAFTVSYQFQDTVLKYFLREMNLNAAKLRMFASNFDSPHGLMNKFNYSSAYDLCLLTQRCMQLTRFCDVVKSLKYTTWARNCSEDADPYVWENTNKLLGTVPGFVGCKTGVTDSAGPCFSGCFEAQGERICIIVLNSKTMDQRWIEVPMMAEWAIRRKQRIMMRRQVPIASSRIMVVA